MLSGLRPLDMARHPLTEMDLVLAVDVVTRNVEHQTQPALKAGQESEVDIGESEL